MRRVAGPMALATGAAFLIAGPVVEACGDKLLSISRGIRLQQAYKARHPASTGSSTASMPITAPASAGG